MHLRGSRQQSYEPRRVDWQKQLSRPGASIPVDFLRSHLREVVSLHQVMFQKLLFDHDSEVGEDLATLFGDVGKTYLRISEQINESCSSHHSFQD